MAKKPIIKDFNADAMSRATGIPIIDIRIALGIKLHEATNTKTARQLYQKALGGEKNEILKKWQEFSLKEIKLAKNASQMKRIYGELPPDNSEKSRELSITALSKWTEFSLKEINDAKTYREAKTVYENTSHYGSIKITALQRWIEVANKEEHIIEAYKISEKLENSSETREYAIQRLATFYGFKENEE